MGIMNSKHFWQGVKTGIPIVLGYIPIGIAYGIMARQAGLNMTETVGMSVLVYAGAAQMAGAQMIAAHTTMIAIVLTTFMMNLRHIMMTTCVMEKIEDTPTWKRVLLSFLVTDESFAVYTTDSQAKPTGIFFFGLAVSAYLSWILASAIGGISAHILPDWASAGMSISLYAMFVALLVPGCVGHHKLLTVVGATAVFSLLFSAFLSSGLAMVATTLCGAGVGVMVMEGEKWE